MPIVCVREWRKREKEKGWERDDGGEKEGRKWANCKRVIEKRKRVWQRNNMMDIEKKNKERYRENMGKLTEEGDIIVKKKKEKANAIYRVFQ